MSIFKRVSGLVLCLVLLASFCLVPQPSQAANETGISRASVANVKGPTLVNRGGTWYYVKNGTVCYDTTLVHYNGGWYYVRGGKVNWNFTGLCKYNGGWYYVRSGKVNRNFTGLCNHSGGWYYVKNGKVNFSYTGLCNHSGGWYYVKGGKIDWSYTGLCNHNGGWYYVKSGKVNWNYTGLCKHNGGWYYVKGGKIGWNYTGLCKYNGIWYYIENGKLNFGATLLAEHYGAWYYVKNGVAQTGFSGTVAIGGIYYTIKNGVLADDSKKVTLTVWTSSEDQVKNGWLEQMEKKFAAEHPEYKITWQNQVCSEGDAGSLVIADPAAAADVYMFANDQLGTLIQAGAISRLGGSFAEQVKEDNSQTLINTVTYTDGSIYGFPMANNTWFMYYNKDVFSEEDVKSLDTMLTKGVVAFPWGVAWYGGTFFLANGGKLFGNRGIDASAGIQFGQKNGGYEAARKMVQLAANPNLWEDCDGLGWSGLISGDVGAYFSGSWDYAALYEALGDKLGAVQLPKVKIGGVQKQMKAFAGSKAVGVNPNAANPKAATQFAAFLASEESQLLRYQLRGVIPAAKNLAKNKEIKNNMVAMAEMNTMTNCAVVQPTIPEMGQYWSPIGTFGTLCANGMVNERNYKEQVNQMMEALNSSGL